MATMVASAGSMPERTRPSFTISRNLRRDLGMMRCFDSDTSTRSDHCLYGLGTIRGEKFERTVTRASDQRRRCRPPRAPQGAPRQAANGVAEAAGASRAGRQMAPWSRRPTRAPWSRLREDFFPNHARAVNRVPELRVGPPCGCILASNHVGEDVLEPDGGDALANPNRVHLFGGVCPHLGVVRRHEGLGELLAEAGVQPLLEIAGLGWWRACLLLRKVLNDAHYLGLGKAPQVGLHRVADPCAAHTRGRVALMVEPVLGRKHLVKERIKELEV
eukprot:scaffold278207_cov28-Tisochrysis_lutea.AAC.2